MNPEEILSELQKRIDQDAMLGAIRDRIADGKATDLDSARYCIRSGTVAGKYLGSQILNVPSDAREALCVDVLHGRYRDAVKQCAAVQKAQDAKQGLHLAPQIPAFNAERAHKIGRSTADPTAEDETIRRRADAPIANAAASVHDDFVRKQAYFRSGAGLSCWLTRDSGSGCCPWCAEIAGRYAYGSEPKDIYARHDNCACTVTFESGRKRGGRSGRQIEHPAPDAGAGEPTVFTAETRPQGAGEPVTLTAAEAARIQAENGLTYGRKHAIINQKISDRMFNSHVYTDDEKKLAEMGVIPFSEIEDALMASPIGRHVAQYIESHGMAIELDYISDSNGLSGEINDPFITVYAAGMITIEEVVETIVHETAHKQFDWQYTQEDEINCRIYEYLSTHNAISEQKIHEIVDFVRDHYSDFPEGNLYGY